MIFHGGIRMRCAVISSIAFFLLFATPCVSEQGLQFKENGKSQTILPLGYSSRVVLGLQRNGTMVEINPHDMDSPKVLPRFSPFSQSEVRGELLKEFGRKYEVTGTGNYLVVHPRGSRDLWANRFEELYRSMTHFFKTRGYPISKPMFPLVGIVFHSESQYQAYCSRVLKVSASNTYGVYMANTNRIYLYDATRGAGKKSAEWEENLATVMHEAAHQTAFNCGVHTRRGRTPVWAIEGLGCLFEARGIYNSFHFRNRTDRINYGRLRDFKQSVQRSGDLESFLMSMVASDKIFQRDPSRAYAAAWALTFYLSEKQPRDYIRYLKKTSKRGPFDRYSAEDRMRDFKQSFGKDSRMLATRVSRFVDELKLPNRGR